MLHNSPQVTTEIARLSVNVAEVLIYADFDEPAPADCELRGRLMGPRSPFAETIEVAYQLRSLPSDPASRNRLSARVIIPEPNLWEPETRFVYWGPIEIWCNNRKESEVPLEIGLRRSDARDLGDGVG